MTKVAQVLLSKGEGALTADPSLAVRDALGMMRRHNVGSLLVVRDGRLVGLFTERDFAWHVASAGPSSLDCVVGDVMAGEVLVVSPDTSIEQCMALMTDKRTRHLPVLDGDELVGIVSIGDVVKKIIDDRDFEIEQLERYITGR